MKLQKLIRGSIILPQIEQQIQGEFQEEWETFFKYLLSAKHSLCQEKTKVQALETFHQRLAITRLFFTQLPFFSGKKILNSSLALKWNPHRVLVVKSGFYWGKSSMSDPFVRPDVLQLSAPCMNASLPLLLFSKHRSVLRSWRLGGVPAAFLESGRTFGPREQKRQQTKFTSVWLESQRASEWTALKRLLF